MYFNVGTSDQWQQYAFNITPYAGQTVRFHLSNGDPDHYVYLDDVLLASYPTTTFTLRETNPPGYASSTPDEVALDLFGGGWSVVNFGDYTVDLGQSSLEVTPTTLTADGVDFALATATLRDALGQPMPGREVEVRSTGENVAIDQPARTTDADGRVSATLRSTHAQTVTVSAYDVTTGATLFDTETLTFLAGPTDAARSTITAEPSAVTADGTTAAAITVALRDAFDNPIAGHEVAISHDGVEVTLEMPENVSDAEGQVLATLRSALAQTVTLQARDVSADLPLAASAQVEFVSTDPDRSTILVEPPTVVADGAATGIVRVTLRDRSGAVLPGKEVTVQVTQGTLVQINGVPVEDEPVSIGTTDAQGVATATIASTRAEIKTLVAVGDGITLRQPAQVAFVAGPTSASESTLTVTPTTVTADGSSAAVATVTLRDAQGNPVPQHEVRLLVAGLSAEILLPDPPLTGSDGVIRGQMRSTAVGVATVSAEDLTAGVTLAETVAPTFVPRPPDPDP